MTADGAEIGVKTLTNDRLDQAFHIPLLTHLCSGFIHRWPHLWIRLGNLESWTIRERLCRIQIDRPVYVAGLARSGSTILLEVLADHPQVVAHRYKDFPPIFTPFWWQEILRRGPMPPQTAVERTHGDGLMVGPDSPEAMEEAIWMAFFARMHSSSDVLDHRTEHREFERFYREHIQKLLLSRGGQRYVSKGNYNVTRLPYLLKLLPDARFAIPIREPLGHIGSLIKQHRLFVAGEMRHPRAREHLRRVGHFEFGLDRRAINTGDGSASQVHDLWRRGEEVRGWARYWASLYGWLADRLEADTALRDAAIVVRYEDLCDEPRETLSRVFTHAGLDECGLVAAYADRIHAPTYYRPEFTAEEERIIREETRSVADYYGYFDDRHTSAVKPPSPARA